MTRFFTKRMAFALAIVIATAHTASANECLPEVSSALDQQRSSYIAAQSAFASQNFSRRPGSFASTTCLDNLMKGGGVDIFFKPPSLDSIIGMVKNLACEQASQIFNNLVGGTGINGGGVLSAGEVLPGVNLGSQNSINLSGWSTSRGGSMQGSGSILELFQ